MKTSRKPRTTKTRTKSDAYFSLSDEEIDRRAREYDEAKDRAALVWKGIGKQARKMNAVAERVAKSKFTGMKFLPKTKSAKDAGIAKAANAIEDMYDEHVSYECRDKDCTLCKGLHEGFTGRLATMSDTYDTVLPEEEVSTILSNAAAISDQKRKDYAGVDPDENFTESARFAGRVCRGLPEEDRRRSTAVLIGVKLVRLETIGLAGSALNESLDDTLTDLINYTAILLRQQKRARRIL